MKIQIIHGPNLNLLGKREPHIYGSETLDEIHQKLLQIAHQESVEISFFQSNHEGALIDEIQAAIDCDGFVINPAAFTHTSIAIRDALLAVGKPFVEVHLSDPKKREAFRHTSFFSDLAVGTFSGEGWKSYEKGFLALVEFLRRKET